MRSERLKHAIYLLFVALAALLVHGYHLGAGDAAIYIPAVKKIFDPQLYPFGAEFFMEHERLSIFSHLVAWSAQILHLPIDAAIFLWYVVCLFLLVGAGWRIACLCFSSTRARWAAVCLLAALLTVPVAGSALVISDPYLTARSLSTPAAIFAVDSFLRRKKAATGFWILLTILVHPQMAVFAIGFLLFLYWTESHWTRTRPHVEDREYAATTTVTAAAVVVLPSRWPQGFSFHPATGTYREILDTRTFFFAGLWHWYEWLGAILPLILLYALTRIRPRNALPSFHRICRAAVLYGVFATVVFLVLSSTEYLDNFARVQPMRAFHVIYVLFFLLLGGLLGEYVLRAHAWRWVVMFGALAIGMVAQNRAMYASSRAVEWPGVEPRNAWVSAFLWVRDNTPKDAVFALDPRYFLIPGEDRHGFRAIAERSQLADTIKDAGAVTMFPQLLHNWEGQQKAQAGWKHLEASDFERLAREYPVTWVVVQAPASAGLVCPYKNGTVEVCRISVRP